MVLANVRVKLQNLTSQDAEAAHLTTPCDVQDQHCEQLPACSQHTDGIPCSPAGKQLQEPGAQCRQVSWTSLCGMCLWHIGDKSLSQHILAFCSQLITVGTSSRPSSAISICWCWAVLAKVFFADMLAACSLIGLSIVMLSCN